MSAPAARNAAAGIAAGVTLKLAAALAAALAPALVLLMVVAALFGPPAQHATSGPLRYGVSAFALKDIPPDYLRLYQDAGERYGIDWAILAAIGKVETDHGRSPGPGVRSGQNTNGCCAGPMQFNNDFGRGGGTWAAYAVDGNHDTHKDIYDPADAIPAAANYLVALGGRADIRRAIFGYNHAWWYVIQVETWADRYRGDLQTNPDRPLDVGRLAWPVRGPVVSPFGPRWGRMHEGIDIAVTAGTPVHAPAAGRVSYAGWMSGYGQFVCVTHTPRLSSCAAHNTSLRLRVGDRVDRGAVIALSGCTGRCFGDHVHFEVHTAATWSHPSAVDPLPYLRDDQAP